MISSDILVVELLESVMADAEIIRRCIELKKLGYIIALDDYEYSENTKALFELADIIKLDFHTSREAVERTAEKCITYNKIMLAEKVETQLEVEYAKRLGCTYMQGYFFAKPLLMTHRTNTAHSRRQRGDSFTAGCLSSCGILPIRWIPTIASMRSLTSFGIRDSAFPKIRFPQCAQPITTGRHGTRRFLPENMALFSISCGFENGTTALSTDILICRQLAAVRGRRR